MIDPDIVGIRHADRVASPDILWVEVRDLDVLDDDVGDTGHSQTFAVEDSVGAETDECLVRGYVDALVRRDIDGCGVGGCCSTTAEGVEEALTTGFWSACLKSVHQV
tara:strand:- start:214 stop:534 length:321 start_codon:yes stop_codon:yes gene_type:complete